MSDDTNHPEPQHIPNPAEVRAEHPTVLVPAHGDEVRRIESHDGEHGAAAVMSDDSAAPADDDLRPRDEPVTAEVAETAAVVEVAPAHAEAAPTVEADSGRRREQEQNELAQVIAATAETVPGVHALGSTSARAVDSARTRLLGRTSVPGVSVLADDDVLNVEVSLVAEYPASVEEVADTVRADVASMLEARHTGPVDIDITVTDVHGPFDPVEPDPGELIDSATAAVDDAKTKTGAAIGDAGEAAGKAFDATKAATSDAVDSARAGAANVAEAAGAAVEALSEPRQEPSDGGAALVTAGESPEVAVVDAAPVAETPEDASQADAPAVDGELSEDLSDAAEKLAEAADALAAVAEEVTHGVDPNPADAGADSGDAAAAADGAAGRLDTGHDGIVDAADVDAADVDAADVEDARNADVVTAAAADDDRATAAPTASGHDPASTQH